jgi:Alpha/beta hydrolase domain
MRRSVRVALMIAVAGSVFAALAPAGSAVPPAPGGSGITAVNVVRVENLGPLHGVPYSRYVGTVQGRVAADEPIVGLAQQPVDADGFVVWSAQFEVIRPTTGSRFRTMVVEAENRGTPLVVQLLNGFLSAGGPPLTAVYPPGLGDAFMFDGQTAYARVQWQTGIAAGVPANAQGIGMSALRDFGRLLREGGTVQGQSSPLGSYDQSMLVGWSQGAWMVDTLVAEGFNVDPQRHGQGIYDGALALDGAGNWLAINQLGNDGSPQTPYVRPNGVPLSPSQLLTRRASDPLFVDIANYTDFYRLRAGVSGGAEPAQYRNGYRRYDWPAAHAPSVIAGPAVVFGLFGCNGGVQVPLNPIDFRPYLRAVFAGLVGQLGPGGSADALPPSTRFELGPEPPLSPLFNGLPGQAVPVPRVDGDAQPIGGVRFVDVELPLGRLTPVSIPPVGTTSINDVCGNFGGYQPFLATELQTRYGTVADYTARVNAQLDVLTSAGYVLAQDRATIVAALVAAFQAAP